MDLATTLTSLSSALSVVKTLQELDKQYDIAVIKSTMADLYIQLSDVKMALSDAQLLLREKDEEIERLSASTKALVKTVESKGLIYEMGEDGGPKGGPFCKHCIEETGRQYRLANAVRGFYHCTHCRNVYGKPRSP